jgi:hypothetical protein
MARQLHSTLPDRSSGPRWESEEPCRNCRRHPLSSW